MKRLKHEAKCLEFIKKNTTIPVHKVLAAYKQDASYVLEMELFDGVEIQDLKHEEHQEVTPQIREYPEMLRGPQSNKPGGPSGINLFYRKQLSLVLMIAHWSRTHVSQPT